MPTRPAREPHRQRRFIGAQVIAAATTHADTTTVDDGQIHAPAVGLNVALLEAELEAVGQLGLAAESVVVARYRLALTGQAEKNSS